MMPPQWRDVEVAAVHDPVLHAAVTLVERGDLTREEAMMWAALSLSAIAEGRRVQLLREINTRPFFRVITTSLDACPVCGNEVRHPGTGTFNCECPA
jgi:hypothetical protein